MFRKLLSTVLFIAFFVPTIMAQTGSIEGTVTDSESGEIVPGANVLLMEANRGAATDADGDYSISDVDVGTYTLRVTFVGYETYTQQVTILANETIEQNIQLSSSAVGLDDVVVVGFGTQSRREVTASISEVSSDDLENISVSSFESALQGKAAGVQITTTSGVLGAPAAVRVRGASSISGSSQPLYVVDGVPVTTSGGSIGANLGGLAGTGLNPLVNLNPEDIESVEVLKDASASAVYGARGSNGVVLITTKSGRSSENVEVDIGYYGGFTEETGRYDMMNGQQFTDIWNTAGQNSFEDLGLPREAWFDQNTQLALFGVDFSLDPDDVESTDWIDLVTRQGFVQQYNASISGGDERTQFFVSGSFRDEEGFTKRNSLNRYTARININHEINDDVSVGVRVSPTQTSHGRVATNNLVASPFTYGALYYPNVAARDENGEPNLSPAPNAIGVFPGTPLSNQEGITRKSTLTQLIANANIEYNILPALALKTDFTADLFQLEERSRLGENTTDGFPTGGASAANTQIRNYNWNNTLTYSNNWDNHDLTTVVGFTLQRSQEIGFDVNGIRFATDLLPTLDSAAEINGGGGDVTSFAFQNNLARVNYTYNDRYLLTLSASYNGSSRFSEDFRYGFFPAASAGWIVSDEDFLQADFIDLLKFRASYGLTGNAEIGNFSYLGLVGSGSDYDGVPGFSPSQLANPDLKWEQTAQLDVGIDYGFLNNRVRGSIAYYNKVTDDLLLDTQIPSTNGFTTFTDNVGRMENSGFEFELTADIINQEFNWTTQFNLATVNNEVLELFEGQDIIEGTSIVREGEPLGAFYVVEYAGVDPENGDALWIDSDGNETNNYSLQDRKIMGSPFPDYYGGFTNTFNYRGVGLQVFVQYNVGNEIYRADGEFTDGNLPSLFNQAARQSDYWSPENTDASVPRPVLSGLGLSSVNGGQSSSRYLDDGSYIRLKTLTLSYTFPRSISPNTDIRIYARGQNLYTIDNYRGPDPEVTSAPNALTQGNVFFPSPQQRTVMMGVELGF